MDTTTGKIYITGESTQFQKPKKERKKKSETDGLPKPDCKKCYGRGYIGVNIQTNEFIPCECTAPVD